MILVIIFQNYCKLNNSNNDVFDCLYYSNSYVQLQFEYYEIERLDVRKKLLLFCVQDKVQNKRNFLHIAFKGCTD